MVLCDIRSRWEKLDSTKKAYFLTGTDEHGLKIQTVAEAKGVPPKQLVDDVSQNFKVLAEKLNLKYDRFIRTTDPDHVQTVQYFWKLMESKGLIYQGSHSGWYSVSDETFYPETQIEEVNGKMISKETKNEVVYQDEVNYFFKLSQFQQQLIDHLENNPEFIIPKVKYNELLRELKEAPLQDLSVSRPSSRLTWGIEVPSDPSQKIYVWFDALLNYLTAAGFPFPRDAKTQAFITPVENIWPATHVIGKDIIRFHCIYWPIFLMAGNIELPRQVVVHSHWLSEGFKMSKSIGNVVDPIETYEYYGQDALRFFLTEYSNIENDCNFSEQSFVDSRDNLIGKYANLMTRCGGKAFNIKQSVDFYSSGEFTNIEELITEVKDAEKIIEVKNRLINSLNTLHGKMDDKLVEFNHMKAIQEWWAVTEQANLMFQVSEPWTYTKLIKSETDTETKQMYQQLQSYYVFLASESCRILSILIEPVIPKLAGQILDRLDVLPEHRTIQYARVGADKSYGTDANSRSHAIPIERVPIRTKE
jgi:methionyl-tRNA synthetase